MSETSRPVFRDFSADDENPELIEIESLCLNCEQNGLTKYLLTKIPFFKEIIVSSFECDHCGNSNNETQFGGKFQEQGVRYEVKVNCIRDLSRQVILSEFTSVTIPELEFEIPSKTQPGRITTIEGIFDRAVTALEQDQKSRRLLHQEAAESIDRFVLKLRASKSVDTHFTFIVDDSSGNSFVENLHAPKADPHLAESHYVRSASQDELLGIVKSTNDDDDNSDAINSRELHADNWDNEVLAFQTNCPSCKAPCETNMKVTKIPHFKEVVIMATTCTKCGHRTNEVKSGAGISPLGQKITLWVRRAEDLSRDVLKSETCGIAVPELDLEVGGGSLGGGKFTTVEGLLEGMKEQLSTDNPFVQGDSAQNDVVAKLQCFIDEFTKILDGKKEARIVLDDPAGNSYIQTFGEDGKCDDGLTIENYERSAEQNDDLGITDMKTENYS